MADDEPQTNGADDGYDYEDESFEEDPEGGFAEVEEEEEEDEAPRKLPASNHAEHLELVDGRRLHPSPRLWILFGLSVLLVAAAALMAFGARQYILAGVFGAIAGIVFLMALLTSLGVKGGAKKAYFDFQRTVEAPERVEVWDVVTATLDASGSQVPGGIRVHMRETPMPGLTPLDRTYMSEPGTVTYRVRTNQRGEQKFRGVDVLIKDKLGMWVQERRYKLESPIEVEPGSEGLGMRAQISAQMAFVDGTPKALKHMFRDVEIENMHEYGPGDRMKDVDWKLYAKTGQMIVRQQETQSSTHGYLVFDVGTSMLMPRNGRRGIDIAFEIAHEVIATATDRTIAVGFFACNENQAIDDMKPSKNRGLKRKMPEKFNYLTDPLRKPETKDPGRKLLQEQPIEASFQRSLKKSLGAKTSILVFTDMDTMNEKIVQVIAKLAEGGAKVGVILMPNPTYGMKKRFRKAGGKAPNGFRGVKLRKELREVLIAQDVEFLDLRYKFDLVEELEREAEQKAAEKEEKKQAKATPRAA